MSLCPCCKVLEKNPKSGYCNPCNRRKVAERYRLAREGKPKGKGWRSMGLKPVSP
jgi:hypothetical protein